MFITTGYVRVWFTTDASVASTGFDLNLVVTLIPNNTATLASNVTVQTLDVTGSRYANNMNHEWILDLRNRTDVLFIVTYFEQFQTQVRPFFMHSRSNNCSLF